MWVGIRILWSLNVSLQRGGEGGERGGKGDGELIRLISFFIGVGVGLRIDWSSIFMNLWVSRMTVTLESQRPPSTPPSSSHYPLYSTPKSHRTNIDIHLTSNPLSYYPV